MDLGEIRYVCVDLSQAHVADQWLVAVGTAINLSDCQLVNEDVGSSAVQ